MDIVIAVSRQWRGGPFQEGDVVAALLKEIRQNPLLWLLALVPVVLLAEALKPDAHTLLFVLSVLAIVPLAVLLSHATESVAARTGDAVGGLLNATLGNLTELIIALAALRAGQYVLVKSSIAGAIVANSMFMLGASFLLGGLKHHVQDYNRNNARLQAGLLFLATIAILVPSVLAGADAPAAAGLTADPELCIVDPAHRGLRARFAVFAQDASRTLCRRRSWRVRRGLAARPVLATLAGVTVLVALVSEVFVESVQQAVRSWGSRRPLSASSSWRWSVRPRKWLPRSPPRARTGST